MWCRTIERPTASGGGSGTFGPNIRTRSGLLSRYGCRTRSTTSRSSEPCHFSLLRRLCASASAPSRPSNLSRSVLLALGHAAESLEIAVPKRVRQRQHLQRAGHALHFGVKHEANTADGFENAPRSFPAVLFVIVEHDDGRKND